MFLTYLTIVQVENAPIIWLFPKRTCIVDFLNSYGRPASKAAEESIVSAMTNLPEITMICTVRAALDVSNVSLV